MYFEVEFHFYQVGGKVSVHPKTLQQVTGKVLPCRRLYGPLYIHKHNVNGILSSSLLDTGHM